MKAVRVRYYAMLREQAGCEEEMIATAAATPAALFEELKRRHGFMLSTRQLRVAVNGEFSRWSAPLSDDALVVFIPPFAGG
jgi:molybdopterin converting factor small subunit